MYSFLKRILFFLPPETAHQFSLRMLAIAYQLKLTSLFFSKISSPTSVMGISFPNCIGLAAGYDKNGDYINELASLGFGFIEVGTVTPKSQLGNELPRLFRLTNQKALINRMGFNNKGCDYLVNKLQQIKFEGVLGINIGKNKNTTLDNAVEDYLYSLRKVYPFASYITINISSPNTENLRDLQHEWYLQSLLQTLKSEQGVLAKQHNKYVPLVVKIAPDLSEEQITKMCEIFLSEKIDGVIATNTTLSRKGVEHNTKANEKGGLSGEPLTQQSTEIIKQLHQLLQNKIPIIASGGVVSREDALEKLAAGASLVQLYTGLIYQGPNLIKQILTIVQL